LARMQPADLRSRYLHRWRRDLACFVQHYLIS